MHISPLGTSSHFQSVPPEPSVVQHCQITSGAPRCLWHLLLRNGPKIFRLLCERVNSTPNEFNQKIANHQTFHYTPVALYLLSCTLQILHDQVHAIFGLLLEPPVQDTSGGLYIHKSIIKLLLQCPRRAIIGGILVCSTSYL